MKKTDFNATMNIPEVTMKGSEYDFDRFSSEDEV